MAIAEAFLDRLTSQIRANLINQERRKGETMRERMCKKQFTMLESELNVHFSACHNKLSEFYLAPTHKDRCEACPDRIPVPEDDLLMQSLADSVYVEMEERAPELVEDLMAAHCKQCKDFRAGSGMCANISCQHHIPVRDLMKNPKTHCVKGGW